jgi:ABC-type glutathione transport system ATPase component
MTEQLLQIRDLTMDFSAGLASHAAPVVLDRFSLTIDVGEAVALVGTSGSGKTTLALAIMGLGQARARSGQIFFDGSDLLCEPNARRAARRGRDLALVFQDSRAALNPLFRIGDQLAESIQQIAPRTRRQRARELARHWLGRVGITDIDRMYRSYPHQLSGGMCQRAYIAMAIAGGPRLLLADEPTASLDWPRRRQIVELLLQLKQTMSMSVLLITHDLSMARLFADRIAVVVDGRVVDDGPTEKIFGGSCGPETAQLIAAQPPLRPDPSWATDQPLAGAHAGSDLATISET